MRRLQRFIVLTLLLVAAVLCYMAGSAKGIGILVGIGLLFELGFWLGLFNSPSRKSR